jgi:hypothetical protein
MFYCIFIHDHNNLFCLYMWAISLTLTIFDFLTMGRRFKSQSGHGYMFALVLSLCCVWVEVSRWADPLFWEVCQLFVICVIKEMNCEMKRPRGLISKS